MSLVKYSLTKNGYCRWVLASPETPTLLDHLPYSPIQHTDLGFECRRDKTELGSRLVDALPVTSSCSSPPGTERSGDMHKRENTRTNAARHQIEIKLMQESAKRWTNPSGPRRSPFLSS
jgi:hypothetical protein